MTHDAGHAWMEGDQNLRRDTRLLSWTLRRVVWREIDSRLWDEVRTFRRLSQAATGGDQRAEEKLNALLAHLGLDRMEQLLRVLGILLDLENISEDRHRERVLRQRRDAGTLQDSLHQRIRQIQSRCPGDRTRELLRGLEAEFVLTAHPTEARRQSVRRILTRVRQHLQQIDQYQNDRQGRRHSLSLIDEDLRILLHTDPLHPHRPTVLEELDRAVFVMDSLWQAVPPLVHELEQVGLPDCRPLRFGCWIGGDRDGHPHVTAGITRQTFATLRQRTLALHRREAEGLLDLLSSVTAAPEAEILLASIANGAAGAELARQSERMHPREHFRRALVAMQLRLGTQKPYRNSRELCQDLAHLEQALQAGGWTGTALRRLHAWKARARVFGLHGLRVDIRENSQGYRQLVRELLTVLGDDPGRESRNDFAELWSRSFLFPGEETLARVLSERAYDLYAVTRLAQDVAEETDGEAVGTFPISMTHSEHDVLWVLWIHGLVAQWRGGEERPLPIVPLFETISDLESAPRVLEFLFTHAAYARHLAGQERRQTVMLGYSDSAKDGGYLAAVWSLYQAQDAMQRVASSHQIELVCFHGRGGALGRGGGPAARAVEALPASEATAKIRITEQGEVIADRFVDPPLAHRHLEQILGGLAWHTAVAGQAPSPAWRDCMGMFSARGLAAYRDLVGDPGFVRYFYAATPIRCIEGLQIGSRPSRRHGQTSLEDLRAIPYTFAWTQSRHLINAYYGLGSAWSMLEPEQKALAVEMYQGWGFFRALIDNAELALTKCEPVLARAYAGLSADVDRGAAIARSITEEMQRTREAVLAITGQPALLAGTRWLRRSVKIRKPFIDVLNFLQIELMRRQNAGDDSEALERCLRMSVQAVAAGLRTTG